jgi:pSer/pThr/pTyr-binding forkhead associated (FHA) protein
MSDAQVIKLRLSLMGRPVRNYAFEKPVISVGRDPAADVYVDNPGVSRDHFRLERTANGEYQIVDLGSANGTFVNDQMVNTAVVHNNDVVRFGKYTLWVGYEADRRTTPRDDKTVVSPVSEGTGHTVILSRAEIGTIFDQEKKKASLRLTTPDAATLKARAQQRRNVWLAFGLGLVLGLGGGATYMWWFLQQQLH